MKLSPSILIGISLTAFPTITWSKDSNGFNHPGLFHSQSDLDRMREAVKTKTEPIFQDLKSFKQAITQVQIIKCRAHLKNGDEPRT